LRFFASISRQGEGTAGTCRCYLSLSLPSVELPRFCGQVNAFAGRFEVIPPFEVDG
jgi:hypothetical protein